MPAKDFEMALPVMSVDTVEHARNLQTMCCCKAYDEERFIITRESGFVRGNADTLFPTGDWLEKKYVEVICK